MTRTLFQFAGTLTIAGLAAAGLSAAAIAQEPAAPAEATPITVELNKLEDIDAGCRIYVVVNNETQQNFDTLKLDLVLFRKDGIVDQRFFVDLAPLKKEKRIVKLFELGKVQCNTIGSFLVNDVVECKSGADTVEDCLERIAVSSRDENAKLTK